MPLMTSRKLSFLGCLLTDSVILTGQAFPIQSSISTWATSASARRFRVPSACVFSRFTMNISTNENASAGATVDFFELNTQGNISVALGTGTGLFTDLVNTDQVDALGLIQVRYSEQDLSADIAMSNTGMSIQCQILGT